MITKKKPSRPIKIRMIFLGSLLILVMFAFKCDGFHMNSLESGSRIKRKIQTRPIIFSLHQSVVKSNEKSPKKTIKVCIVGAGPSGLLAAHCLLKSGKQVSVYESRPDPRLLDKEDRAYALGIGIRGRTAIRSVDESLWNTVKARGYESERFDLYLTPKIKLRLRNGSKNKDVEPSLLLYQSDLCAALLDGLEKRYPNFKVHFKQQISMVCSNKNCVSLESSDGENIVAGPFDVIVGCDGVNSVVRKSIEHKSFTQKVQVLPGEFKVCQSSSLPSNIDSTAVSLILPKAGSTTAFFEPTSKRGGCILFSTGRGVQDKIMSGNLTGDDILERFPLLDGVDLEELTRQLKKQAPSRASSVQCNIYHCGSTVLCGDAAHATGGVSGQGVNSGLVDATVLAECLQDTEAANIQDALLKYSKRQVPEGKALYDLSFGPEGNVSFTKQLLMILTTAVDFFFQGRFGIGRPPLQTLLGQTLISFSDIRRKRNSLFIDKFPDVEVTNKSLEKLHNQMKTCI